MASAPHTGSSGFTLLEVLVSVIILSTVALLVASVLTRAQQVTDIGREQFIATAAAREGLELVRAVRDTNWGRHDDKSQWLAGGICADAGRQYTDQNREIVLDAYLVRNVDGVGDVADSELVIASNGEWRHGGQGQGTGYARILHIDCSTKDAEPAYVTVTAEVTWESRGKTREVLLTERLYNWRPTQVREEEPEEESESENDGDSEPEAEDTGL